VANLFHRFLPKCDLDIGIGSVGYAWDDWDPYPLIRQSDEMTAENFVEIPASTHILFSMGCAEIGYQLLFPFLAESRAPKYLDALWAPVLSREFVAPLEPDFGKFSGRLFGMLGLLLSNALNAWYGADENSSSNDAAFAYQTIQHILGGNAAYHKWTVRFIQNMAHLVRRNELDALQLPLPIELLCGRALNDTEAFPELCLRSLRLLDLQGNEFVRKAK